MDKGLVLSLWYQDDDIVELSVAVSNGSFSGETNLYVAHDALAELASKIEGFPFSSDDRREFDLGAFGPSFAGGATRLRLLCVDLAGHCALQVDIETEAVAGQNWPMQKVSMVAAIEAAAVDRFVAELRQLEGALSGNATLSFAI
jgi:hypothetical protein